MGLACLDAFEALATEVDVLNACDLLANVAAERGDVRAADEWAARAQATADRAGFVAGVLGLTASAVARVRSGASSHVLRFLADAASRQVQAEAELTRVALAAAEALVELGRLPEAAPLVAAHDRCLADHGQRPTPRRGEHRRRVLDRLAAAGIDDIPGPTLCEALALVRQLVDPPSA